MFEPQVICPQRQALLERLLTHQEGTHFASVDASLRGTKARQNLALVYQDMGRHEDAKDNGSWFVKALIVTCLYDLVEVLTLTASGSRRRLIRRV